MKRITVQNISKKYQINAKQRTAFTFREAITDSTRRLKGLFTGETQEKDDEFYALKDVSFDVKAGEVFGILGVNGSGKSTLLKILSRVTTPTSGEIRYRGRVASLLEVGTGFHSELTGRENIFLNGVIMGMSHHEVKKRFDEIIEFSGVERFIDTPVKRYSSGMILRLAFSVAAHLDPDIFIIDEVLAVGDASFQRKCIEAMERLSSSDKTLLFVSHHIGVVRRLCTRALLLKGGEIACIGPVEDVVAAHLGTDGSGEHRATWTGDELEDEIIKIHSVEVGDSSAVVTGKFNLDQEVVLKANYSMKRSGHRLAIAFSFYDQLGTLLFMTLDTTNEEWKNTPRPIGSYESRCHLPPHFFNGGEITVFLSVIEEGTRFRMRRPNIVTFNMIDEMEPFGARADFIRVWPQTAIRPLLRWDVKKMDQLQFKDDGARMNGANL